MKVCYFGTYEPNYPRNRTLINGLIRNGVQVIECQERFRGYKKLPRLTSALRKKHSRISSYDVMIVGYPGQWIMPLAEKIARGPIIFDAFISFYEKIRENKKERGYFWKKYLYKYLDKKGCVLGNKILLDTNAHIQYFVKQFNLPQEKLERILVGTDERLFYPRQIKRLSNKFKILFYAKFLPLHGGECVVRAAKALERQTDIIFTVIGDGKGFEQCQNLANEIRVKNIIWYSRIPYLELPKIIAQHDLSLGIFGGTPKAMRVIPNKVYEAMAMQKPFITGNSPAIKELLTNRKNAILCKMAKPDDLADKIIELKENQSLRNLVSQAGRKMFEQKATSLMLGNQLKTIIFSLWNQKT